MQRTALMPLVLVVLAMLAPSAIAQIGGGDPSCDYGLLSAAEANGVTITINISGVFASGRFNCNKLADSWNHQLSAAFESLPADFPGAQNFLIQPFSCTVKSLRNLKLQGTMTLYGYWTFVNMASTCAHPAGSALFCSTWASTQFPPYLNIPSNQCSQLAQFGSVIEDDLSAKVAAAMRCTSVCYVDSIGGVGAPYSVSGNRKALF